MKKILIVDDNMDFLRILSSALQKRFQTYESMGVADALKILESVTVDAVCSDFNMRDGTGLLLGVSGVFVANGRAVNWHPITYCFSFIQCDSIYTTVLKIPFSCLAIVLYLLLSVIIYRLHFFLLYVIVPIGQYAMPEVDGR